MAVLCATGARGLSTCSCPGKTTELGDRRERSAPACPPDGVYDDELPRDYWDPAARAEQLAAMGVDEAVVFPNFGLRLGADARPGPAARSRRT